MRIDRIQTTFLSALVGLFSLALTLPAFAQNPFDKPDDTWITIDGVVETVTRNAITLDYGESSIIVEIDDRDRDADAYRLLPGDKVTVFGMIDDDFFEGTTIEARSVYIEKLGTNFYATVEDDDWTPVPYGAISSPVVVSATTLEGVVTSVADDEFTLNTGARAIDVSISSLGYNPLDDEGYQQIDVGDRVWASGKMNRHFIEGRELKAESVVILHDNSQMAM